MRFCKWFEPRSINSLLSVNGVHTQITELNGTLLNALLTVRTTTSDSL